MVFIVDRVLITKFETGVITAMSYVSHSIMQIVSGVVIDKINQERFITIGLLGAAAASNIVIYFNQNYVVMLLAWSFN